MTRTISVLTLAAGFAALCSPTFSQETPEAVSGPQPTMDLQELLQQVAENSGTEFLVDIRSKQTLYVGGTPIERPTYPLLLSILRNNGLVAVD